MHACARASLVHGPQSRRSEPPRQDIIARLPNPVQGRGRDCHRQRSERGNRSRGRADAKGTSARISVGIQVGLRSTVATLNPVPRFSPPTPRRSLSLTTSRIRSLYGGRRRTSSDARPLAQNCIFQGVSVMTTDDQLRANRQRASSLASRWLRHGRIHPTRQRDCRECKRLRKGARRAERLSVLGRHA
jgi:hypothetical protein